MTFSGVAGVRLGRSKREEHGTGNSVSVVALVDELIAHAYTERASDIHLHPTPAGVRVRLRIDGVLEDLPILPLDVQKEVVARTFLARDISPIIWMYEIQTMGLPKVGGFCRVPAIMKKHLRAQGFTLIEVLIVIGIIAILAAIVIIAINPAKQFAQARNTQRESAIASILNAIGQNMADNRGTFTCAGAHPLPVNTASSSILIDTGIGIDLSCLAPTYLPSFPLDPTAALGADTGYTISVDSVGRVLVCAPAAAEPTIPDSAALCVKR